MIHPETRQQYLATIGIECHVQLKTKSKLFSGESNDARDKAPNTVVGHVSFGIPGALPVLNEKAVELAVRAAFALNTEPQKFSKFDRKHYFYPDLPKGYQISQFEEPIILGGYVEIEIDGETNKIGITRAHMEEDAGKSTHPEGKDYSLVDLNRAGTPLLEIVSEPEMHTPAEARAFAKALYLQMKYADVSDVDLYHGNMRFDVNVSVSKDPRKFGTRSETKNLNSFKAVEKAVEFEINRQIELLEKGGQVVQETRGWDDSKQKTFSQRTKEDAHDYRYMPEPDIPPIVLTEEYIKRIKSTFPVMPSDWRHRLAKLGLKSGQVEELIEANISNYGINYLNILEECGELKKLPAILANWFINIDLPFRKETGIRSTRTQNEIKNIYHEVFYLLDSDRLSSTNIKVLIRYLLENQDNNEVERIAEKLNLLQVSDKGAIEKIVAEVLAENEKAAQDVKNGEMKAIGFLVGQVMAKSKGQANPGLAQQIIKKQLNL